MKDAHAPMRKKFAASMAAKAAEEAGMIREPATRPKQPAKVENVPTTQRPLFVGSDDEPGQSYLFGTGVEPGYGE